MDKLLEKFEIRHLQKFCESVLGDYPKNEYTKDKISKKQIIKRKERGIYTQFIKKKSKFEMVADFAIKRRIVNLEFIEELDDDFTTSVKPVPIKTYSSQTYSQRPTSNFKTIICSSCKKQNLKTTKFCQHCGYVIDIHNFENKKSLENNFFQQSTKLEKVEIDLFDKFIDELFKYDPVLFGKEKLKKCFEQKNFYDFIYEINNIANPPIETYDSDKMKQFLESCIDEKLKRNLYDVNILLAKGFVERFIVSHDLKRETSIEWFNKALKIKPGSYKTYMKLGIIFLKLKDQKEAAKWFNKIVEIKPNDYKLYIEIGNIYQKFRFFDGQFELDEISSEWYRKPLFINPEYVIPKIFDIYEKADPLTMGEIFHEFLEREDKCNRREIWDEETLSFYNKILSRKPDWTSNLLKKGNLLLKLNRKNEAIKIFQEYVKKEPTDLEAWKKLSKLQINKLFRK